VRFLFKKKDTGTNISGQFVTSPTTRGMVGDNVRKRSWKPLIFLRLFTDKKWEVVGINRLFEEKMKKVSMSSLLDT